MVLQREIPDPPCWLDLLFDASRPPNARNPYPTRRLNWAELDVTLLPAVTDLVAWFRSPRPYEPAHRGAWLSMVKDVRAAIAVTGPRLRRVLEPVLDPLLRIPDHRFQPGQPMSQSVPGGFAAAVALQQLMGDGVVLAAAWSDLAAACRTPEVDFSVLAARRDDFWRLVQASDRDEEELSHRICGVVCDQPAAVAHARSLVGEPSHDDSRSIDDPLSGRCPDFQQRAGVDEAARVALVTRTLSVAVRPVHHVIWFAFDRARIPEPMLAIGRVSLLRPELLATADLPELSTLTDQQRPHVADGVFARVDLGVRIVRDVVAEARREVDAVVALAKFVRRTDGGWIRRDGHLHAVDGRFLPSERIEDVRPDRSDDDVEWASVSMGDLAAAFSINSALVVDAAPLLGFLAKRASGTHKDEAMVMLNVRVLEYVASQVERANWAKYAERHLRQTWVRTQMIDQIGIVCGEAAAPRYDAPAMFDWTALEHVRARLATQEEAGGYTVHLPEALDELDRLLAIHPHYTFYGRQVALLHRRVRSVAALETWAQALQRDFARRLQRLRRVRNAVTHGGPTTTGVIQSAVQFSGVLADWALERSVRAVLAGEEQRRFHERSRVAIETWRQNLAIYPTVRDALWQSTQPTQQLS
jgi:hypothetical protein